MVGHWNRFIFTPGWITSRLTKSTDVGLEVSVENPSSPIRFAFDGLRLRVTPRRIEIKFERPDDDLLERGREVAIGILSHLSHTPVSAVGLNFQFLEDQPEGNLLGVFRLGDLNDLSDAKVSVLATSIQRKLMIGNQIVNLVLSLQEDGKLLVALNFHAETPDAGQAAKFLEAHAVDLKDKAIEILRKVYKTEPEMEEEHA